MRPDKAVGLGGDVFPNFEEERRRRRQSPPRGRYRPGVVWGVPVEGLESRLLFAVIATHNTTTNTLTITGDSNGNEIEVYQQDFSPNTIGIHVVGQSPDLGPYNVDADLTLIKVFGNNGGDIIKFGSDSYGVIASPNGVKVSVPAEIHGGDGADSVRGTDNADTVWGDAGNDTLQAADGNDTMYGGYGGEDVLEGDDDNDLMYGGDGGAIGWSEVEPDTLYGEAGNDTLHGESGNDYIDPGDDDDTAFGGDGNDTFRNSIGATDWLERFHLSSSAF